MPKAACLSRDWLRFLRLGLGLQLICYCLTLRRDWLWLFSNQASFIPRDIAEGMLSINNPLIPRLGWFIKLAGYFHLSEWESLCLIWLGLLLAGLLLTTGYVPRIAATGAWFLHLCAVKSSALTSYGMDNFTTTGLFYLMVSSFIAGSDPTLLPLCRRVLQLHLCLIYFFGGLAKAFAPAWWNGESIWRALTREPFNLIPTHLLASFGAILPLLGIAVWLLELSYPILIWLKRTRLIWLVAIISMHVSIALTMGLYQFALIMIVLNLAGFAPDGWFAIRIPWHLVSTRRATAERQS